MFDFLIGFIGNLLSWVVDLIFSVVHFPDPPPGLVSSVNQMFDIIRSGLGFVDFFLPLSTIAAVLSAWFAVWSVLHAYHLLMWILRKFPFLGIE